MPTEDPHSSHPSEPETRSAPITVFLPGEDRLAEEAMQAISPQAGAWSSRSASAMLNARILMVDDELLNIEMTEAFLAEAGYQHFRSTDDPRQAIPLMRAQKPSLVLLDLSMPHIGGLEILEQMREDPKLRHLPVIVLTSSIDPQVKLKALAAGAVDFLSKPVDPSELGLRIRNTLTAAAYRDYLAQHDALTGLPNKRRYEEVLAQQLEQARAENHGGAVIHIGVDRLGYINNALGRAVGDHVLQRLARRLASVVETEVGGDLGTAFSWPTLYRFDGDEFAVLVPYVGSHESLAGLISKIMEETGFLLQRPGHEVFVTCSVGIAVYPEDGRSADQLGTNAGLAMHQAKAAGRNTYEFFSRELNASAVYRLRAGADLQRAFSRDEMQVRYAPRVDVASGRLAGVEATVEWRRQDGTVVAGSELMALASSEEVELSLTEWMVEQVVENLRRWSGAGLAVVPVAVSVSMAQLAAKDLAVTLRSAMRKGLLPEQLLLQLNRPGPPGNLQGANQEALAQLSSWGFRLALDRFGGDETALLLFRSFAFDEVTLDPRLAQDLQQPRATDLLRGTLRLLERLGLPVTVTGIDTLQHLAAIRNSPARFAQGALYAGGLGGMDFAVQWLSKLPKPNPAQT